VDFSTGANFTSVVFSGGRVSFVGAVFSSGWVSFDNAIFAGGRRFSRGEVSFVGAEFSGGRVTFDDAEFSGSVTFDGAKFSGGRVTFDRTKFSGRVTFYHTVFSGGDVDMREAIADTSFALPALPVPLPDGVLPPRSGDVLLRRRLDSEWSSQPQASVEGSARPAHTEGRAERGLHGRFHNRQA
jgi:hypothetical protein